MLVVVISKSIVFKILFESYLSHNWRGFIERHLLINTSTTRSLTEVSIV